MSARLSVICRTTDLPHTGTHLAWGGCQGTVSDWGRTDPCECSCHLLSLTETDAKDAIDAAKAKLRKVSQEKWGRVA